MGTDSVIVCEGPETGLALHEALARDVLAVGGTSGFAAVEISKEVSTVIFAADHDANGTGERAARAAAQQHHDSGKTVHVVIPEQPGDWLDVLNQGGPGAIRDAFADPPAFEPAVPARPEIQIAHRQLRELTADAIAALVAANDPPEIFRRGEALVRVQRGEADRPVIRTLGPDQMVAELTRVADFYRAQAKGDRDATPPRDLAINILAQPSLPFPSLRSVVEQPIVRPDGTVVDQPGYDVATQVYYAPAPGLVLPTIPVHPTRSDIDAARDLLEDELLGGFPFDSEASRAHAIATLITPALREGIRGPIPIAIVDKPQAGSGASPLADCISLVVSGRPAAMMTPPQTEEEWQKTLLAIAEAGTSLITIDNVDRPIRSAALSSSVTAESVYGRRLGSSTVVHMPQRAIVVMTGNNIRFGGDIGRRVYVCRIDPKMARPWRREGFRHPNLKTWTKANRGKLLAAILTLVRAWYAAGKPPAFDVPRLGGFEEWTETLAGVLQHAGISGFLQNLETVLALVDEDTIEWEVFVRALGAHFESNAFRTAEVVSALQNEGSPLRDAVPGEFDLDGKSGFLSRRLGRAFSKRREMRFGADEIYLEVAAGDTHTKVKRWKVCGVSGDCGVRSPSPVWKSEGDLRIEGAETNPPNPVTPQIPEDACPECGGRLDAKQTCWACNYRPCKECGAPTGSALRPLCMMHSVTAPALPTGDGA